MVKYDTSTSQHRVRCNSESLDNFLHNEKCSHKITYRGCALELPPRTLKNIYWPGESESEGGGKNVYIIAISLLPRTLTEINWTIQSAGKD